MDSIGALPTQSAVLANLQADVESLRRSRFLRRVFVELGHDVPAEVPEEGEALEGSDHATFLKTRPFGRQRPASQICLVRTSSRKA